MSPDPLVVSVTGAAGNIAYSLLPILASGQVFGSTRNITIVLFDQPSALARLEGTKMELDDLAYPLLRDVVITTSLEEAFVGADYVIMLGAIPRGPNMERSDLLKSNGIIFVQQGRAIAAQAKPDVKVLVVGNPANTNARILIAAAPTISRANVAALTRLDENRARSAVAQHLKTSVDNVENVIVWGNHSPTQFPDLSNMSVKSASHVSDAKKQLTADPFIQKEFVPKIQTRGAAVIAKRGTSSAMSAAKAVGDCLHDWAFDTPSGRFVSIATSSDGSYGVPADLLFSFPCTVVKGTVKIHKGLPVSDELRANIEKNVAELTKEHTDAFQNPDIATLLKT